MRHHTRPVPRETEPEKPKPVQRDSHGHQHSNGEVMLSICRRLIPLLEEEATEEGMRDAEACTEGGVKRYGPIYGEKNVLLSKLHDMLNDLVDEEAGR